MRRVLTSGLVLAVIVTATGVAFAKELVFKKEDLEKAHLPFLPELKARYGDKATYTKVEILSVETPKPTALRAEEVKTYFDIVGKLDPTKAGLYTKLVKRFGEKTTYTSDEVAATETPKVSQTQTYRVKSPQYQVDSFPAEKMGPYFRVEKSVKPDAKGSLNALQKNYPDQTRYSAAEIRNTDKNGGTVKTMVNRPETPATFIANQEAKESRNAFLSGWRTPLIRHDWTDVLAPEDPSVNPDVTKTKVDDLVGATFSFTRDNIADTNTWSAVGALIWPWFYHHAEEGLLPPEIALAPSVSVNRVSSNDPKTETDQLLFRLGTFLAWYEPFGNHLLDELDIRAAPVFGTDTAFEARMPGYEFDLEPRWLFNNGEKGECMYKIGFRNIIWPKEPLQEDLSDLSVVDYQVRVWFHIEGGDIQDTGKAFAATTGSFFRLGPTVQLRVNTFFPVPLLSKGLSFTAQYSYLSPINGPDNHNWLLTLSSSLTILADKVNHKKLSLTASYTKGGLVFTKQDVDIFTLGLSVLF